MRLLLTAICLVLAVEVHAQRLRRHPRGSPRSRRAASMRTADRPVR